MDGLDDDDEVIVSRSPAKKARIIEEDLEEDKSSDQELGATLAINPESPDPEPEPEAKVASDDEESDDEMIIIKKKKKKGKRKREDDEGSSEVATSSEDDDDGDGDDNDDKDEDEDDDDEDDDDDDKKSKKGDVGDEDDEKQEASDHQEDEEEDEDEKDRRGSQNNTTLYDFDIMMAKKKEENSRKRRRRGYDIINDNDDIIADIINQMKDAVEADSEANKKKMAATRKLKLLPYVINQLRKVDLRDSFLDADVLSVLTEWLAPLPDRSLPHLNIRENLLKILIDFNLYDVDRIKGSGIGKAVMYLYKHPKETKENKQRAKQLISCWSRPIFQLDSSFNAISKEEREQRDLELMKKQRRASRQDSPDGERAGTSSGGKRRDDGAQKPGDKGWIPRARVPAPSMKDYVIRPQSKVDGDVGKNSRRPANMLEKYMKNQQDRRRANRQQRAINMKIDRV